MIHTVVCAAERGSALRRAVRLAAAMLKRGGVVVFPTETVYGLAADPAQPRALARLRTVKGRSASKAITLQVARVGQALKLFRPDRRLGRCAREFWPGPLTIVARARRGGKIGIRIPRHRTALGVLEAFGKPLAVTSANPSGGAGLWRRADLENFFDGKVDMILWERSRARLASTIVEFGAGEVKVLRQGRITGKEIHRVAHAAA